MWKSVVTSPFSASATNRQLVKRAVRQPKKQDYNYVTFQIDTSAEFFLTWKQLYHYAIFQYEKTGEMNGVSRISYNENNRI